MKEVAILITISIGLVPLALAAHFIIGVVENALDGEDANGKTIVLWNPVNGMTDNQTDTIGPTGNSGANNTYMIDCELLQTPCDIGDNLSVQVIKTEGYTTEVRNVTVTGAGFDQAENLTLNSPLTVTAVIVDDEISNPPQEIDLIAGTTREVTCSGIITDYDNETEVLNASATFFDATSSSYESTDDNNDHYTNASCVLNTSYGDTTQVRATCGFTIEYYANASTWNCTIEAYDVHNNRRQESNTTAINELLAIGVDSPINYGIVNADSVSQEQIVNISNYGNTAFNLSLSAYGVTQDDNLSMNCLLENITLEHQKYNLSTSYNGNITLTEIQNNYTNMSSGIVIREFDLAARTNDAINDANKTTYWRIYAPTSIGGSCSGSIVFGAVKAPGV